MNVSVFQAHQETTAVSTLMTATAIHVSTMHSVLMKWTVSDVIVPLEPAEWTAVSLPMDAPAVPARMELTVRTLLAPTPAFVCLVIMGQSVNITISEQHQHVIPAHAGMAGHAVLDVIPSLVSALTLTQASSVN
jgi:hypothetical protein